MSEEKIVRTIYYAVCTKCWDNFYTTFIDKPLYETDDYGMAENWALNYKGHEEVVFIKEYFKKV